MRALRLVLLFFLPLLVSCSYEQTDKPIVIGFSQCTEGDDWRLAMREEMLRELSFHPGLSLQIKDAKNSSQLQVQHIRELMAAGVDILIVSPNEADPITPVVEEAYEKGIPVIVVDRKTSSSRYTAYIGGDNYEIGKLAGSYAADLLEGRGNIMEIWGLRGSSPALHRHTGFMDALAPYKDIKVVAEVHGEWEKDVASARLSEVYDKSQQIDLVFAHNDVMALGAYEQLKAIKKAQPLFFLGVDGLGGQGGGLELVEAGILDATFLYPTGGEEIIRLAAKILAGEDFQKENLLKSTVVDKRNVQILKQQTNKILQQQQNIERQQQKLDEQLRLYRNQRLLLYAVLFGTVVIIVLAALSAMSLREKSELNKVLTAKNQEVVSQRNEIAKMARKADKATEAKVKFFTNVSHEFRTPLTLILAPVEDVLNSNIPQEAKKELELVKKNANRLLKLVNQLMDFRKVENKKMKLRVAERDVVAFVEEVATAFQSMAKKNHIRLDFSANPASLPLYFDADKLDKVLFNLLSNAFKFTPEGGEIQISVGLSAHGHDALIDVKDSGRGMTAEQQEHAFDRFYSGEYDGSLGTGLGLALSREFVKLHRGDIQVKSKPGLGTSFTICLPLGKAHLQDADMITDIEANLLPGEVRSLLLAQAPPGVEAPAQFPKSLREHTLLLIEDNEELRQFLKEHLQKEFNVVEASDGELGLSLAFEMVPDLVLSDVMLPARSGLEVATTLKTDRRTSHIPVVLLTAHDALEQKIAGVQTGADLYVTKPFSYQYLIERIKGLIKNRELLKAHHHPELPPEPDANISVPRQLDQKFINEFMAVVEENISNASFSTNDVATSLGMSRVQVYRKVKAVLGCSVNEYVVNARLNKAKQLLLESDLNISEVAYEVGFSSPGYFSTAFKNHFNQSPSDFKASMRLGTIENGL